MVHFRFSPPKLNRTAPLFRRDGGAVRLTWDSRTKPERDESNLMDGAAEVGREEPSVVQEIDCASRDRCSCERRMSSVRCLRGNVETGVLAAIRYLAMGGSRDKVQWRPYLPHHSMSL